MFTVRIGESDYVAYEKNTIREWLDENRMSVKHMLFNHLTGKWGTVGEFLGLETKQPEPEPEADFERMIEPDPSEKDVANHEEATDFLAEIEEMHDEDHEPESERTLESMTRDSSRIRALRQEEALIRLVGSANREEIVRRYERKVMVLRFFSNVVLLLFLLWGWGTGVSIYGASIGQIIGIGLVAALFGGISFAILRGVANVIELLVLMIGGVQEETEDSRSSLD